MLTGEIGRLDGDKSWITPEDVPTPTELPRIPGFQILVRAYEPPKKVGSILLPDQTRDDVEYLTNLGQVVKIGEAAYKGDEFADTGPWCEVGDYIVWKRHGGRKIAYDGVVFVMINDTEVLFSKVDPDKFSFEKTFARGMG